MKAAVLSSIGESLTIEDVEVPKPKKDELLVKIVASGICHTDLHAITGSLVTPLPSVLGHEGAGIVEEVGEGAEEDFSAGDHVVLYLPSCRRCNYCSTGKQTLCKQANEAIVSGLMPDGSSRLWNSRIGKLHHFFAQSSFAEYAVVSKNGAAKISERIDLGIAAMFGCGVRTGIGAVSKIAKVKLGSSVAIFGCGGVGLSAVIAAKASGASEIIAVDVVDEKLQLAKEIGATQIINSRNEDPIKKIKALTSDGVEYSFEFVGNPSVMRQAFDSLRPAGKTVVAGAAPFGSSVSLDAFSLLSEKSIVGTSSGGTYPPIDIPIYLGMYSKGILPIDRILSERLRIEEVNHGFDLLKSGHPGRTVVTF
jgi:Zn-dependent alcohol dehydrogenase